MDIKGLAVGLGIKFHKLCIRGQPSERAIRTGSVAMLDPYYQPE